MHTGSISVSAMRMPYCASALALGGLLAAAPQGKLVLPSGGSVTYSAAGSETRFEIRGRASRHYEVRVERDATVAPDAAPDKVELIAEVSGKALVLTDSYPSVPLGIQYCQAGEEQFLRVITLAGERASETLHLKLTSCRDNVELANPGLEWNRATRTLLVHWLDGPDNKGASEEHTIRIGPDGKPQRTGDSPGR
jgi:hypothetical protein